MHPTFPSSTNLLSQLDDPSNPLLSTHQQQHQQEQHVQVDPYAPPHEQPQQQHEYHLRVAHQMMLDQQQQQADQEHQEHQSSDLHPCPSPPILTPTPQPPHDHRHHLLHVSDTIPASSSPISAYHHHHRAGKETLEFDGRDSSSMEPPQPSGYEEDDTRQHHSFFSFSPSPQPLDAPTTVTMQLPPSSSQMAPTTISPLATKTTVVGQPATNESIQSTPINGVASRPTPLQQHLELLEAQHRSVTAGVTQTATVVQTQPETRVPVISQASVMMDVQPATQIETYSSTASSVLSIVKATVIEEPPKPTAPARAAMKRTRATSKPSPALNISVTPPMGSPSQPVVTAVPVVMATKLIPPSLPKLTAAKKEVKSEPTTSNLPRSSTSNQPQQPHASSPLSEEDQHNLTLAVIRAAAAANALGTSLGTDSSQPTKKPSVKVSRKNRTSTAASHTDTNMVDTSSSSTKSSSSSYERPEYNKHCTWPGCSARFPKDSTLLRHYRCHTGEKPFVCRVGECTAAFSEKGNLVRHESSAHNDDRRFACPFAGYCTARFKRAAHVEQHVASRHTPFGEDVTRAYLYTTPPAITDRDGNLIRRRPGRSRPGRTKPPPINRTPPRPPTRPSNTTQAAAIISPNRSTTPTVFANVAAASAASSSSGRAASFSTATKPTSDQTIPAASASMIPIHSIASPSSSLTSSYHPHFPSSTSIPYQLSPLSLVPPSTSTPFRHTQPAPSPISPTPPSPKRCRYRPSTTVIQPPYRLPSPLPLTTLESSTYHCASLHLLSINPNHSTNVPMVCSSPILSTTASNDISITSHPEVTMRTDG